jgi:predicted nucleotide-binding protein
MSSLSISVRAARLDASAVSAIKELIRPFALADATKRAEHYRSDDEDANAPLFLGYAEEEIAKGGYLIARVDTLTQRNGVVHRSDFGQELSLDLLDDCQSAEVSIECQSLFPKLAIRLHASDWACSASIEAPGEEIETLGKRIEEVLTESVDVDRLAAHARPFKVFIGHGSDPQWKYLKRALSETHRFTVEAFESSERAGYHTLVVIDQMVRSSSVAVVVMTGEDRMEDGSLRARENVVHEVGFCQGVLGIDRTIVLLEEGVSEPSNIVGLTQIRFPVGALIDVESKIVEALEQRRQAHLYSEI